MKSQNSPNDGSPGSAPAGVPAWAISRRMRRIAAVAASSVLIGKMTIR